MNSTDTLTTSRPHYILPRKYVRPTNKKLYLVHGINLSTFPNLLLILSVNNSTHMYLSDLRVYFKVEVYFRVT